MGSPSKKGNGGGGGPANGSGAGTTKQAQPTESELEEAAMAEAEADAQVIVRRMVAGGSWQGTRGPQAQMVLLLLGSLFAPFSYIFRFVQILNFLVGCIRDPLGQRFPVDDLV